MLPHERSPDAAWRRENFREEDRVEDMRAICPRCAGAGLVREWSTPFFVITVVGYVIAAAALFYGSDAMAPAFMRSTAIIFFLVGCFGLFILIDREKCPQCGGMGKLDDEDD